MRHRSRRWAVPAIPVALALFVLGPVTTDSAPAPVVTNPVKILQLNICHSGIMDCFTGDAVITKARSVIGTTRPQVLSVNEACANDVEPLRQAMGPARAVFVAAQRPNGTPVTCTNGQQFGNMIMVTEALAGSAGSTGRYASQDTTSNEMRVWACLPAGVLTACTTHLSSHSGTTALAQCHELMDRAAGYATTAPTVVVGDMNLRYRGTPNVQDCNRPGFYRKGDGSVQHVFATTTLTFVGGTRISMSGTTDHPAWLVTTTMS